MQSAIMQPIIVPVEINKAEFTQNTQILADQPNKSHFMEKVVFWFQHLKTWFGFTQISPEMNTRLEQEHSRYFMGLRAVNFRI